MEWNTTCRGGRLHRSGVHGLENRTWPEISRSAPTLRGADAKSASQPNTNLSASIGDSTGFRASVILWASTPRNRLPVQQCSTPSGRSGSVSFTDGPGCPYPDSSSSRFQPYTVLAPWVTVGCSDSLAVSSKELAVALLPGTEPPWEPVDDVFQDVAGAQERDSFRVIESILEDTEQSQRDPGLDVMPTKPSADTVMDDLPFALCVPEGSFDRQSGTKESHLKHPIHPRTFHPRARQRSLARSGSRVAR
jgi:hypothetical protein